MYKLIPIATYYDAIGIIEENGLFVNAVNSGALYQAQLVSGAYLHRVVPLNELPISSSNQKQSFEALQHCQGLASIYEMMKALTKPAIIRLNARFFQFFQQVVRIATCLSVYIWCFII